MGNPGKKFASEPDWEAYLEFYSEPSQVSFASFSMWNLGPYIELFEGPCQAPCWETLSGTLSGTQLLTLSGTLRQPNPWEPSRLLGTLLGILLATLLGMLLATLLGPLLFGTMLRNVLGSPLLGTPVGTLLGSLFGTESSGRLPRPAPKAFLWLKTPSFQLGKNVGFRASQNFQKLKGIFSAKAATALDENFIVLSPLPTL